MNGASSDDVRRPGAHELGGRADLDAVLAASRLEVPGVSSNYGVRTPGGGNFQKGQVTRIREHDGEPESRDRLPGHFDEIEKSVNVGEAEAECGAGQHLPILAHDAIVVQHGE